MSSTHDGRRTTLGVASSLVACGLFALMFYYTTLLAPLSGSEVYGWRIMPAVPLLLGFIWFTRRRREVAEIWHRVRARPQLIFGLLASSALLNVQLWLFMWAPINGYGLDVSLGYFLLPLTLVATGAIFFRERISRVQIVACVLALVGVINELVHASSIAWPAFVISLLYPLYYALRRRLGTANLGGMWVDMAISLPIAVYVVSGPHLTAWLSHPDPRLGLLVIGLGLISALALVLMISSSQLLSLPLFGLLSYVEPVLLVAVALLLGDHMQPDHVLTYVAIWLAVIVLGGEGVAHLLGAGGRRADARRRSA